MDWDSTEVVAALRKHFGKMADTSVAKLEQMVYKNDLHKFNAEFGKVGASCIK